MRRIIFALAAAAFLASTLFGQANGKLQIHFMDVGQGDGAVLISPRGEVVLFDAGKDMKRRDCSKPLAYLDQLGVKRIDYLVVSHYHFDHIGCVPEVLDQAPLQKDAFDRGQNYPGATYDNYVSAVSDHRKTPQVGDAIRLDQGSGNEVVVTVVALNGAGIKTSNENDLSLAATIAFGQFKAEISGDLSGDNTDQYEDIETSVAPKVGRIDVYKVHHHCSSHSTNEAWLTTTKPTIGIISTGDGNSYGHPSADCLERLHKQGVRTYWTEAGAGADPEAGLDVVGGNIVVEVALGAATFTVRPSGSDAATYPVVAGGSGPGESPRPSPAASPMPKYAWSKNSPVYHLANCDFVASISPENLQKGDAPPEGKRRHKNCPVVRER